MAGTRFLVETPSSFILPAATCGSAICTWAKMQQVSPFSTDCMASGEPLYGTCTMSRPALALNSAKARCVPAPLPVEA